MANQATRRRSRFMEVTMECSGTMQGVVTPSSLESNVRQGSAVSGAKSEDGSHTFKTRQSVSTTVGVREKDNVKAEGRGNEKRRKETVYC